MKSLAKNAIEIPEMAPFKVLMWPESGGVILRAPYGHISLTETAYDVQLRCKCEDIDKLCISLIQAQRYLKTY